MPKISLYSFLLRCPRNAGVTDGSNTQNPSPCVIPLYIRFMPLLTLIYLVIELSFNARILDLSGGIATSAELASAEHAGRIISGAAVALAVLGTFLFPALYAKGKDLSAYITGTLLVCTLCIPSVYYGERALVDSLAANSTTQERHTAALLTLASHQIRRDGLDIRGMDISKESISTAGGKSFVALFAPLLHGYSKIALELRNHIHDFAHNVVITETGGVNDFYDNVYVPSADTFRKMHTAYAKIINAYAASLARAEKKEAEMWMQYVRELRKHGFTPSNVPPSRQNRVRKSIQEQIPVSSNWRLDDRAEFSRAFFVNYKKEMDAQKNDALKKIDSTFENLPTSLSTLSEFTAYATVQEKWWNMLNLKNVLLTPNMSRSEIVNIYERFIENKTQKLVNERTVQYSDFADGGPAAAMGIEAMRAVVAPPLCLFFSIIGAILHICKFGYFTFRNFMNPKYALAINACAFIFLLIMPFGVKNSFTNNRVYHTVENKLNEENKFLQVIAFRWIIQAQTLVYPFSARVRDELHL